jgi:PAS domain S-box-containing protein
LGGGLLVFFWLRSHQARLRNLRMQYAAEIERAMLMKHFEYLTKYANDIVMLADEHGNIVEVNERAEQVYGYSRAELLGKRISDLRDPNEYPAVFREQLERIMQLGELRFETVNVRRDGTRFPIESSARVIEVEGKRYLQGVIRDISERKQAEEALRRSETLLKKSQQMAHIGSWELDLKKNILYWSDENYRIFEVDQTRFGASYEAFLDTVHPDDRDWVNRAYTDSVNNKKPYTIVHRLQFPDRRVKFVQEWCETFYDEAGKPLRSIGTTQDITVQQLAQSALRKSAQQVEDLYNLAPCGYHSLDRGGMIVQINDTELQWLGYARDEVVGKVNFADLLAPGSRQVFRDNYPGFKQRGYVHDLEYELVRKDGTSLFVSLSATAVYDADGVYLMSRSSLFDITLRKQAETMLAESEGRFRIMADSAPIMIWIADAASQINCHGCRYFNRRWHEFTDLPVEQAQSCAWQDIVHPDDHARMVNDYREAFLSRQPFDFEYRLRRGDGDYRWVQDSGVPRCNAEGEFIGFIGTCLDVTDLKLFDEMRAEMEHAGRLQIAGEMASGLAHELSQPLSAASNYLGAGLRQMAEPDWDRDKLLKTVTQAQAKTERAVAIISHLKDLVRKQRQERAMLDINALIRDTVHFMEYEIRQHAVSVVMDFYTLPPVPAGRVEIEQVLINLFKNAIDAMAAAPTRVLRIATRAAGSGFIQVSVSDTGAGIAAGELDKVFYPFRSSKNEGLGLGLPICRSVVENHGGRIWVEQPGDQGAEFNFTLPVGDEHA